MTIAAHMAPTSHRKASYQDVLDAPPNKVAEVIAGTLHMQPRPAFPHAIASSRIGGLIGPPFDFGSNGPGGWWIVFEPELHLEEDIIVPDLAGWRRETLPGPPSGAYSSTAPDWTCEVLSPSTRKVDIGPKRDIYAREGVSHLWFIDPDTRTLEAFMLQDGQWLLIASLTDDAMVSVPPFDAISFPLALLWPECAPTISETGVDDNS